MAKATSPLVNSSEEKSKACKRGATRGSRVNAQDPSVAHSVAKAMSPFVVLSEQNLQKKYDKRESNPQLILGRDPCYHYTITVCALQFLLNTISERACNAMYGPTLTEVMMVIVKKAICGCATG